MRSVVLVVLMALSVLTGAQRVLAQPSESTSIGSTARDEEARRLFQAGEMAYADGRYENALSRFREAHELSGRPRLLFNIAAASERLRRDDDAIGYYEQYLEALPEAPNRREVEARLEVLRSHQSTQEDLAMTSHEVEPYRPNVPAWIFGAATAAFGGAALGLWLAADSEFRALEQECSDAGGCTDERVADSSVEILDRLALASLLVAGAAAIGTVLAIVLKRRSDDDSGEVTVAVGLTAVTLGLKF